MATPVPQPMGSHAMVLQQTLLPLLLVALALQLAPAWARARATQAPTLQPGASTPAPIDAVAPHTPTLQAPAPGLAPLQAPPTEVPRIVAPSTANTPLLPPPSRQSQQVQQELERLQRQAASGTRGYGSTNASAQAAWQLGLVYLHGAGVRQDALLAQQWFSRAASHGREPWAYAGLAWCAIDGCVAPPNIQLAERNLTLLRRSQPARADFLSWLQASRQAPAVADRPLTATNPLASTADPQLLRRAGTAGDVPANVELGIIASGEERHQDAKRYFQRAAPHSPAAQANLQTLARQTSAPVQQAAPSASAQQALAMAQRYHRGSGVPANFAEAIRFYRIAAAQGSQEAQRMLELIQSRPMPDGSFNIAWMQQLAQVDTSRPQPSLGTQHQPLLQRDPTPLFDQLPAFWRGQVTALPG